LSTRVTPLGKVPAETEKEGEPEALTVKEPALPTVKVVEPPLLKTGKVFTVKVKDWVAFGATPLFAAMVIGKVPAVPLAGVPPRVAVPLPLSTKVTPLGNAPDSERAGFGTPVVVTMKVEALPTVKEVLLALVMAGA